MKQNWPEYLQISTAGEFSQFLSFKMAARYTKITMVNTAALYKVDIYQKRPDIRRQPGLKHCLPNINLIHLLAWLCWILFHHNHWVKDN